MATTDLYLENPDWQKFHRYALGEQNTYQKRWVQGSPGMMEPMPIYSNEYSHLYMLHGQAGLLPYRGGVKQFSPLVTRHVQEQVHQCARDTLNPVGCSDAVIRKVYTKATQNPNLQDAQFHSNQEKKTPHPFDVGYQTGYSPYWQAIPPNHSFQG